MSFDLHSLKPSSNISENILNVLSISEEIKFKEKCDSTKELYIAVSQLLLLSEKFIEFIKEMKQCSNPENLSLYYPLLIGQASFEQYKQTVTLIDRYKYNLLLIDDFNNKKKKEKSGSDSSIPTTLQSAFPPQNSSKSFLDFLIEKTDLALQSPTIPLKPQISALLFQEESVYRKFFCSHRLNSVIPFVHIYEINSSITPQQIIFNSIKDGAFLDSPEGILFSFNQDETFQYNAQLSSNLVFPLQIPYDCLQNVCERISTWTNSNAPKQQKEQVINGYKNAILQEKYNLVGIITFENNSYRISALDMSGSQYSSQKKLFAALYCRQK